jgi:hypothetical protein
MPRAPAPSPNAISVPAWIRYTDGFRSYEAARNSPMVLFVAGGVELGECLVGNRDTREVGQAPCQG